MPRPFVRGYDRQAVSRIQGGGVYMKGCGFGSTKSFGSFVGFDMSPEQAQAKQEEEQEMEAKRQARLTPVQRLMEAKNQYKRYKREKKMGDFLSPQRTKEVLKRPFKKMGRDFDTFGSMTKQQFKL
jgi:hypothetical protein